MKFSANSKALEKVLSKVYPAVPQRAVTPVIENFLLQITDNLLTVTATDGDMFITCTLGITANGEFEAIVPAKLFFELVKSLPDTMVNIEAVEGKTLNLKLDTGMYQIGFAAADDFPSLSAVSYTRQFSMKGDDVRNAIEQTAFAASKEPIRPAMTGVLFDITDEGLKLVATDGHRLVRHTTKSLKFEEPEQIVVPVKAMDVLLKFVEASDVHISYTPKNIMFRFGDVVMSSNLIEQKFPAYNAVIPLENDKIVTVERKPLISIARRMLLFDSSTFPKVKFKLSENMMEISSEDIEKGSHATDTLPCEYKGDSMEIAFNTNFLVDMLSHLDQQNIVFRFESSTRAALINGAEEVPDKDVLMLLMPVRLNV